MSKSIEVRLAEMHKDIRYIKEASDKGFADMKERQDLMNGRLMKSESLGLVTRTRQNVIWAVLGAVGVALLGGFMNRLWGVFV